MLFSFALSFTQFIGYCLKTFFRFECFESMMSISKISIQKSTTVLSTLKQMDIAQTKMLLVFDGAAFYSIITI